MIQEKLYSEKGYKIVFDGEIKEGCVVDEVKKRLSGIFKWDQDKVEELFSVTPLEIADNIDYQTAMTYKAPFERAGAICKIYHSQKATIPEDDSSSSHLLKCYEIKDSSIIYPGYDFEHQTIQGGINLGVFDKRYISHLDMQQKDQTRQGRQIEIKTHSYSNIPILVENKELLNKQRDEFYECFSNIYKQAKRKTAGRKNRLIIHALTGSFFLLSFIIPMISAMKGLYAIGIAGGLSMAFFAGIIKYPLNNKANKNRLLKTALYFKHHIPIEDQENLPFFLAALILWAQKISELDIAKDEMLSVCNEIALANTTDIEMFKKYLKRIGDLDRQAKCELNNNKDRGISGNKAISESYQLLYEY